MVWRCRVNGPSLTKAIFCAYRFFYLSCLLIVYGEPPQAVLCYLALPWFAKFQKYGDEACKKTLCRLSQQHHTSHSWLSAKVMYSVNSTKRFPWLTRSISIFFWNVQIYLCYRQEIIGFVFTYLVINSYNYLWL